MEKYSCLDCKHYCPERHVYGGKEETLPGIYMAKDVIVEHRCPLHPETFIKWWDENKSKNRADISDAPSCFELRENISLLKKIKVLSENILSELKKSDKEESEKSTVGSSEEDVLKVICDCCDITSTHNLDK